MALLSRKLQKIFGGSGGTSEFGRIGSEAAGSPVNTKDLDSIQSLSQYLQGLFAITASAQEAPRIEDINSLYLLLTTQLKYLFQEGIPEWIATEEYYAGSFCAVSGSIYISLTGTDGSPNINNNPASDPINWLLAVASSGAINRTGINEIFGLTEKTTLSATDRFIIETLSGSDYVKRHITGNSLRSQIISGITSSISSDYEGTTSDGIDNIDFAQTALTGLIRYKVPSVSENTGREIVVKNTGNGLSYCYSDTSNIVFKGQLVSTLKLFHLGNYYKLKSNGTYWFVLDYESFIDIGFQNNSDWTSRLFGNAFDYDNKSAAVDMTGQKFTESTSSLTFICLYDTGGTAASGKMYFYNITGVGYLTDNRTITAGSGATALVNELTSSKNNDENLYHGFGVANVNLTAYVNTSSSMTNAQKKTAWGTGANGFNTGQSQAAVDANQLQISGMSSGSLAYMSTFTFTELINQDYYVNFIISF